MRGRSHDEDGERGPRPRAEGQEHGCREQHVPRDHEHEAAARGAQHVPGHEVVDGAVRQAAQQARDERHPGRPAPAAGDGAWTARTPATTVRETAAAARAGRVKGSRGRPGRSAPPAPVRGGTKTVTITPRLLADLHHALSSTGRRSAYPGGAESTKGMATIPDCRRLDAVCDSCGAGREIPDTSGAASLAADRDRIAASRERRADRQVTRPPTSRPTPGAPPRDHGWR